MPEVSPGSTTWLERGPGLRQQTRRSTRPLALAGWVAGLVPAMIAGPKPQAMAPLPARTGPTSLPTPSR